MAGVAIDAGRQLGVRRVDPEQHVGVAVASAQRVVHVVTEIEVAHVVGRAWFRLLVPLDVQPHLDVVASLGHRKAVGKGRASAHIQSRDRFVGRLDGAVRHTVIRQVRAVAARRGEPWSIRPFVDLRAAEARKLRWIRVRPERLDPWRVDAERLRVEGPIIEVVRRSEAPPIVRVAEGHFVDERGLENLRHAARGENARRVLVDEAGAGRESIPTPVIVAILDEPRAPPRLLAPHLIDAEDVIRAAVERCEIVRGVRRPLLSRLWVEHAVRRRQQVEHLLAEQIDPVGGNHVPRERQACERVDDRLNRPVGDPGLGEVSHFLERRRHVGAARCRRPRVVGVLLRAEEEQLLRRAFAPAVDEARDDDRPADGVTRDVDPIKRLRKVARLAEVIVRIESIAPAVVPTRTFELTRPRLRDHADEAAVVAAVLRGIAVGQHLNLTDRVHVQVDEAGAAPALVDDVHAVNAQILVNCRRAVDRDCRRRRPRREVTIQVRVLHARQQIQHRVHVAALDLDVRQIVERDRFHARAIGHLDRRHVCGHREVFLDRAERE